MIVYTAHIVTESADHYVWVYAYEPTREQVIERLQHYERAGDLDWYEATTHVHIEQTEVIE
jgi:hypothetical protein